MLITYIEYKTVIDGLRQQLQLKDRENNELRERSEKAHERFVESLAQEVNRADAAAAANRTLIATMRPKNRKPTKQKASK